MTAGNTHPRLFVGRDAESVLLGAAVDDAASGRGRIVLITGEPGIGKSALAEQASEMASSRGFGIHWGSCWEAAGAPPAYWPWVQVIRSLARDRSAAQLMADLGDFVPVVARIVPEIGERFVGMSAPQEETDPDRARFQLFDAITRFLKSCARDAPLQIVLDDLHWADRASLLLLRFLAGTLRDSSVLVIGTYRDAESGREQVAEILGELAADRIALTGLAPEDVDGLIKATTGTAAGEGVAGAVHTRTAGNPFFIKEVARLLAAQGRLANAAATVKLSIPEGVRDVVLRRLARLSEECVNVLAAASVLGADFRTDVVATIAGKPADAVLELLDESLASRLVVDPGETVGVMQFSHALVREVLYDGLTAGVKASSHQRAGEALEKLYAASLDMHLPELAHHFVRAIPAGEAARAAEYSSRAGSRALSLYAYEEAAEHFRRAVDAIAALAEPPLDKTRLLLNLADALTRAGELPDARDTYVSAAALARSAGDAEALAHAALGLGTGLGGFEVKLFDNVQIGLLKEALEQLPGEDSPVRAWLMARLSVAQTFVEPAEERARLSRDAVAMARRADDPTGLAYALSSLCDALAGPEHVDERIEAAGEIVRIADDIRSRGGAACGVPSCVSCLCDPEMSLLGRRFLIVGHLERADVGAADVEIEAYARIADHLRQPLYKWYVPLWRGMREFLRGHFDEIEPHLAEAERIGAQAHSENATMLVWAQRGAIGYARGDLDAFCETWRRMQETFPELGSGPQGRVGALWLEILRNNVQSARTILGQLAASRLEEIPLDSEFLSTMLFVAEAAWRLNDASVADCAYEKLLPHAKLAVVDGIGASVLGSVSHPLGQLAALLDRNDAAARHFEDAVHAHGTLGSPWLVARAQRDYALALARAGRSPRVASRLADAAATAYRELGLDDLAEDAVAILKGASVPQEAASGMFRRDGEVWTVGLKTPNVSMKDSKGMHDIAALLGRPGVEVYAGELVGAPGGSVANPDGVSLVERDTGPVIDERAKAEYKRRLAELEEDATEAEANNDPERASQAREAIAFITAELTSAFGLGGRARKTGDPAERARKAVTERIRDVLGRIEKAHPELGRHLRRSVRTGTFCSYIPDEPVNWSL